MIRFRKILAVAWLVVAILAMAGCGKENKGETQDIPETGAASLEATTAEVTTAEVTTAAPTTVAPTTVAETTVEPTTEPPKLELPDYRFAMIDHTKIGDNYYSTYFLEFKQPGYYISDSTGKSKYYDKDNGNKFATPVKVFQWVEDAADGMVAYKVSLVFMSKEQAKVPLQNLTFEVPTRYQYANKETVYVDTVAYSINAQMKDIPINSRVPNTPVCLGGHYLGIDTSATGSLSYGVADSGKGRDYAVMEFSFIRLSFEDIALNDLKGHLSIAKYNSKTNSFQVYTPPEGFQPHLTFRETTQGKLRYVKIGIGLSYPKGYLNQSRLDIKKEISNNMVLVYIENDTVLYYAYFK